LFNHSVYSYEGETIVELNLACFISQQVI
jgi:hypothetical protein